MIEISDPAIMAAEIVEDFVRERRLLQSADHA
jgi:hypothetical protein